jgi:hypothetical protein
MNTRPYDESIDTLYSPDATANLYLTEEMVNDALAAIPAYDEASEKEARSLVIEIESLNRAEKLGKITAEKCFAENKRISDYYLAKFGFWPYMSKTYSEFYELFSI